MTRTRNQTIGQRGEQAAIAYLQARGYTLLARNWRCTYGELDVVMHDGAGVVFVEVRTRRAGTDAALASLSARKLARVVAAAQVYVAVNYPTDEPSWRVDVVAVALAVGQAPHIEHLEDALQW